MFGAVRKTITSRGVPFARARYPATRANAMTIFRHFSKPAVPSRHPAASHNRMREEKKKKKKKKKNSALIPVP
eukprot:NODE_30691_length_412_cov_1.835088.p2 GENE.NODE_30691_length_412_cov_1.835088~~NODE_30691_length_412_cov_1.835088.p2  ORF type:complete len:73 (-),score=24.78 NODE_30691_length_412_cov_1.835088:97-315(-)